MHRGWSSECNALNERQRTVHVRPLQLTPQSGAWFAFQQLSHLVYRSRFVLA